MWSSQTTAETGNKNMTSLKSKITHRKRKNSKSKSSNAQQSVDAANPVQNSGTQQAAAPKKIQNPTDTTTNRKHSNNSRNRKNSTGSQKGGIKKGSSNNNKTVERTNSTSVGPDLIENLSRLSNENEEGHEIEVDTTCNRADVTQLTNGAQNPADFRRVSLSTDVLLQHKEGTNSVVSSSEILNNNIKRYSDSFVVKNVNNTVVGDNFVDKIKSPHHNLSVNNSRVAACGELYDPDSGDCKLDKSERKSRRFSDIFRYGALKPASSCENIKNIKSSSNVKMMKEQQEYEDEEFPGVALRRKPNQQTSSESANKKDMINEMTNKKGKKLNRSDSKLSKQELEKSKGKKVTISNQSVSKSKKDEQSGDSGDSYLKRVKSKIYKNKTDNSGSNSSNGHDILPSMPNIAENTKSNKKSKKKKGSSQEKNCQQEQLVATQDFSELRKSASQFDFRLIRQTSNLERIRPKTFGLRTSTSNLGIPELYANPAVGSTLNVNTEKPILAKSKSSSAINLNLLRTRRNKLLEQAKRNCKIVQNEFDFIAFGAVRSAGVQVSRKFGNNTLTSSISSGLDIKSTDINT
ncbi:hypothetical protein ILUMI_22660, partial [Ignelater luminosus]